MNSIYDKYPDESQLVDVFDKFDKEWKATNDIVQGDMIVPYSKHLEEYNKFFYEAVGCFRNIFTDEKIVST